MAYERWGNACVDHLIGEYAVAIWDQSLQRLLLFRDHFGQRPLYYFRSGSRLVFASEIKGLLCFPWVPRNLCTDRLMEFLGLQSAGLNEQLTFYQDIHRVHAATSLHFSEAVFELQTYWQPDPHRETRLRNDAEYVEAFLHLFNRAVKRRLPSNAAVGICLSGGFDSSGIAISAAAALRPEGRTLKAFVSVAPENCKGPARDVRPYCDALRQRIPNLELHYVTGEGTALCSGHELFEICEAPAQVVQNRLSVLFRYTQEHGVTQMLAGFAGDQAVTPMGGGFLSHLFLSGQLSRAIRELRARSRQTRQPMLTAFLSDVVTPLLPKAVWHAMVFARDGQAAWRVNALCNPATARRSSAFRALRRNPSRGFRSLSSIRATSCRGLSFCMSGRGFEPCYNLAAHHQMGFGLPMLDKELVEFALALPPEQHVRNGRRRYLIRRALAQELPAIILDRNERDDFIVPDVTSRFLNSRNAVSAQFGTLKEIETVRRIVDVNKMAALMKSCESHDPAAPESAIGVQVSLFMRGLDAANFIRWFQDGAAVSSERLSNQTSNTPAFPVHPDSPGSAFPARGAR